MTRPTLTKRRLALIGLPVAGALLLGTTGAAFAADAGSSAPAPAVQQVTSPTPGGQGSGDTQDNNDQGDTNDTPSYHSSVTSTAKEGSGSEAAADMALSKLAKIDLAQAARNGAGAVSGGTAVSVELSNEGGNVVYVVDVVTSSQQTEVVVDAGNGNILAKAVEHDDGH